MKVNEENYILLLRRRNEKALDYVIDNYGGLIKVVVKKQLYNLSSLQDECINDILLGIWNNIDKFDEKRSEFKNWVIGIAKFKSIDYKRKYLRELAYENIDELNLSTPDNTYNGITIKALEEELGILLSYLKEEDRELFRKIYLEEKDILEIVKETGLKREIIYNRISKGKKKIRRLQEVANNRG
ncbi:sigma-70 family RNA polymerase sigma factor [Clostridium sp. LP20]|uniref:sigma-70 family RNA polymerase sigma factor n=1 Tax=Clostridium sp. LP20 TaxID=3418665 RepID=UPI003EE704C2